MRVGTLDRKPIENEPKTIENQSKTNRKRSKTNRKRTENDRKRRRNEAFEFDSSCGAPQRAPQLESNSNATAKFFPFVFVLVVDDNHIVEAAALLLVV